MRIQPIFNVTVAKRSYKRSKLLSFTTAKNKNGLKIFYNCKTFVV